MNVLTIYKHLKIKNKLEMRDQTIKQNRHEKLKVI